ncbi:MAG: lipopolysaccharide transport periplasmic protein LptA [Candidatus Rokubacteria bacterium]|nr:lipopolysaccharide transport periplasmic protein LptA [Candidatus Rokubacteria bacterium]
MRRRVAWVALAVLTAGTVVTLDASVARAQAPRPTAPGAAPTPPPRPGVPGTPASTAPAAKPAAPKKDDNSQPVTVDADKMDRFGKESLIIFTGNVVARQNNSVQYADRMEVYLDEKGDRIVRTVSTGSVRIITKDCKTGTAKRVEYFDLEQRMVLIGNARVWQEDNVVTGDTITIFMSQDRSLVQSGKQERVKAVFYQKSDSGTPPAPASATTDGAGTRPGGTATDGAGTRAGATPAPATKTSTPCVN